MCRNQGKKLLVLVVPLLVAAAVLACGGGSGADATSAAVATGEREPAARTAAASPTPSPQASSTWEPPATNTAVPPTDTRAPPTGTPVPPTDTPVPPTATPEPPPPAPEPTEPVPPPQPSGVSLRVAAVNSRFDAGQLTVPEGALVTVALDNEDGGVPHNIAFYDHNGAIFARTELESGPDESSVTFTAPAAGRYTFICEVHPRQMVGSLVVE